MDPARLGGVGDDDGVGLGLALEHHPNQVEEKAERGHTNINKDTHRAAGSSRQSTQQTAEGDILSYWSGPNQHDSIVFVVVTLTYSPYSCPLLASHVDLLLDDGHGVRLIPMREVVVALDGPQREGAFGVVLPHLPHTPVAPATHDRVTPPLPPSISMIVLSTTNSASTASNSASTASNSTLTHHHQWYSQVILRPHNHQDWDGQRRLYTYIHTQSHKAREIMSHFSRTDIGPRA